MHSTSDEARLEAIGQMMLRLARRKFKTTIEKAQWALRYLWDEHLGALPLAEDLPPKFREAYADMVRRLAQYICAFDDPRLLAEIRSKDDVPEEEGRVQWCADVQEVDMRCCRRRRNEPNLWGLPMCR